MTTYFDTSALVKLVMEEEGSERAAQIWYGADGLASSALVVVEGRAALAAARRGGRLGPSQHRSARDRFSTIVDALGLVDVTDGLIATAADLAEIERLRGYDAVHLAAALAVEARVLTSADSALCDAAERHGLHVANPVDA